MNNFIFLFVTDSQFLYFIDFINVGGKFQWSDGTAYKSYPGFEFLPDNATNNNCTVVRKKSNDDFQIIPYECFTSEAGYICQNKCKYFAF